jgi:hypothetical protein
VDNASTAELLKAIKRTTGLLAQPDNDFTNSRWQGGDAAIKELVILSRRVEHGDLQALDRLGILFAPTGTLQEVSIDSGWGDEFLDVASDFDRAAKNLQGRMLSGIPGFTPVEARERESVKAEI